MFNIKSSEPKVIKGYKRAEEIIKSSEFILKIMQITNATYSPLSGFEVARRINDFVDSRKEIKVEDYAYKSKAVIATTYPSRPDMIFVNSYNFSRFNEEVYVRNGLHEFAHIIGLGHGSNYTQDTFWGRTMCKLMGDKEDKSKSYPYLFETIGIKIRNLTPRINYK